MAFGDMNVRIKICGITSAADALAAVEAGADALGFVFYERSPRHLPAEAAADIIRQLPLSITRVGVFVDAPEDEVRRIVEKCGLHVVQLHGEESPEFCARLAPLATADVLRAAASRVGECRPVPSHESRSAGVPPASLPSVSLGHAPGGETPLELAAEDGCATGFMAPEQVREEEVALQVIKAFRLRTAESLTTLPAYPVAAWLLDSYVPGQPGGTGATFNWDLAVEAKKAGRPIILAGGLTPDNVAVAVRRTQPYGVDVSSGVEASPRRKDPARLRVFVSAVRGA